MSTAIRNKWAEVAFVLVTALFIAYGITAWWPAEPALKISPLPDPRFAPHTNRLTGTPASYGLEGGR